MKDLRDILGKEFYSKLTSTSYGVFRECDAGLPADFPVTKFGAPFAEDSCGNLVSQIRNGSVCFWDHETGELTVIAASWDEFASGCLPPKEMKFEPVQVKSAWVDPEFAKKLGIAVPKDGWIKKKG